ncbi:MAG TPA: hypothetical protein VI670_25240 [Thermoanaerobaculia bacterium]
MSPTFRAAAGEDDDGEIARLIRDVARPIAEGVTRRFIRSGELLSEHDAQDVVATVMLRLIERLRKAERVPEAAIVSVTDYVATLTFNAVNDHFRARYPERSRLRNRIRYALGHDRRLALWTIDERLAGGLAPWRGAAAAREQAWELPAGIAANAGKNADRPAETLVALFEAASEPFFLRALVDTLAPLWLHERPVPLRAVETRTPLADTEWRALLATLWKEITELRPMQRKALLLNLRDAETSHALDLFVVTGTATIEEIAASLDMTAAELSAIWSDLPLDDLRIAAMLQLSRQQVIGLRKSARERLTRRLKRAGSL